MARILIAASRAFSSTLEDSEAFKQVVLFCAAGLLVSVLSILLSLAYALMQTISTSLVYGFNWGGAPMHY